MSESDATRAPSRPLERLGDWVGLIGGAVALVSVLGGGAAFAIQYFATRDALDRVDCAQHWSIRLIEAQTEQRIYQELYADWRAEAAIAQIAHAADPSNPEKLRAYRAAVDEQDDAKTTHDEAKARAAAAREERTRCAHPGPSRSRAS